LYFYSKSRIASSFAAFLGLLIYHILDIIPYKIFYVKKFMIIIRGTLCYTVRTGAIAIAPYERQTSPAVAGAPFIKGLGDEGIWTMERACSSFPFVPSLPAFCGGHAMRAPTGGAGNNGAPPDNVSRETIPRHVGADGNPRLLKKSRFSEIQKPNP
jgi:hypothetical protein